MYIQCKDGFMEIDRWDGSPIPAPQQSLEVHRLSSFGSGVYVVRSRSWQTLDSMREVLQKEHGGRIVTVVYATPEWDYPFRIYLTGISLSVMLTQIVKSLDYRNFKDWTSLHKPADNTLAHDIWYAAARQGGRV